MGGRGDGAFQPLRTGDKAFQAEHFTEAREPGQWLFQARGDEGARALATADQALLKEHFQGFARGNPGDAQQFAEVALRRQCLLGFPLAGMDRRFQIARQLQVQRRGLGVVRTECLEVIHVRCPMRILECCRPVVQRKLIPLKYHVNASTLLWTWGGRPRCAA